MGVLSSLLALVEERVLVAVLSVVVSALLHGAYDYIASTGSGDGGFLAFIAVMFVLSYVLVGRMAKQDQYI